MKLYILRHGETDWNVAGKLQGRIDIPLNENGRKVAIETRKKLKAIPFAAAYTSPLGRARETAQLILQDRDVAIIEDERIIEVGFGIYEGQQRGHADENIENFFRKPEIYCPMGDGEEIEAVFQREREFLEMLKQNKEYQDKNILIVTHGAALSGLLCVINGWEAADFWKGGLQKNCGVTIAEIF